MTKLEMKKDALALIEELDPSSEYLTEDPDIADKIDSVMNHVMYELARVKKIPKYLEMAVKAGQLVTFAELEKACGYEIYQVKKFGGVDNEIKADGTVYKINESGTAEVEVYVYPERITEKTRDKAYEFELSPDVLEIMPYGIAADLLKSDESAQYGRIYADRYEAMKQRLERTYKTTTLRFKTRRIF